MMQTFLPYRSFESSARVLDRQRLGKQRVETMQIMNALVNGGGWANHPVTKMWRGYEYALMSYQQAICDEYTGRGYNDSCLEKTRAIFMQLPAEQRLPHVPPWLGKKKLHSLHRANLLRKSPMHYNQYHWPEQPANGYWYPVA
jgi:hypothetical protein